jgi:transposase-like protein
MSQPSLPFFQSRHFDHSIILLCVRWRIATKFSCRDLVAMMAERGVDISHNTIPRWVQRFVPEFEKRWMWKGRVNSETVKRKC